MYNAGFKSLMVHSEKSVKDTRREKVNASDNNDNLGVSIHEKIASSSSVAHREVVKITEDEEKAVNRLGFDVYQAYIVAASGKFRQLLLPMFVLLMILSVFNSVFSNNWLSFWITDKFVGRSSAFYIGLYIMFTFLGVIFLCCALGALVYGCITASKTMNLQAANRLMHAPTSYTDTTPMGRILNRFTKDIDVLDNELPEQIYLFTYNITKIGGSLILLQERLKDGKLFRDQWCILNSTKR
ncbi:unnamed protein product [Ambrosiozyma monospora]|uniref:Unnamed protein product n=1 Tax=Ambrosiozyma monospora TaxID=43982 RepID=A0A9W6SYI8_AMBMO|nr:unnamed protein product [Ambrosiozyma monospora]